MNRRDFIRMWGMFLVGPALPRGEGAATSTADTNGRCGICGSPAVFDKWLDVNLCPTCGARETTAGWQG